MPLSSYDTFLSGEKSTDRAGDFKKKIIPTVGCVGVSGKDTVDCSSCVCVCVDPDGQRRVPLG